MITEVQQFENFIFQDLKKYISEHSQYKPYIFKEQPEDKLFPLVIIKEKAHNGIPTTLKYSDYKYDFSLEINIFTLKKNNISGKTICKEISDLIERYFLEKYRMKVTVNPNAPNIDSSVSRTLIYIACTLDTKFKDKLIIYPKVT